MRGDLLRVKILGDPVRKAEVVRIIARHLEQTKAAVDRIRDDMPIIDENLTDEEIIRWAKRAIGSSSFYSMLECQRSIEQQLRLLANNPIDRDDRYVRR